MKLDPGTHVGPYEIVASLGAGGAGEVYRAHDPRLRRDIALKLLSVESLRSASAVERFEREARAASALNHPNILTIHEVGSAPVGGALREYIATEFIDGITLAAAIRDGARIDTLLPTFVEVAEGLAKAHEAQVVHRDLKPENIMITTDGYAKILDFGLAKLVETPDPAEISEDTSTVSRDPLSSEGVIVGTVPYMAPEQLRGEEVDARCDVFAFGCMLYEAATGERAFRGRTAVETIEQILTSEPPRLDELHRTARPGLHRVVRRCLAKAREQRYGSSRALLADLKKLEDSGRSRTSRVIRLQQLTFSSGVEQFPALSPDGTRLLFCREDGRLRQVFCLDRASGVETRISDDAFDHIQPTWSPDLKTILFVRANERGLRVELSDVFGQHYGGSIWSFDVESGRQSMLIADAFNPSYAPDGNRVAFDASWSGARRIWISDARGRHAEALTSDASEAVGHIRPRWSPDGERIVFQNVEGPRHDIRVADIRSRELHWVTNDVVVDVNPVFSFDGESILFSSYRAGGINIWRAPVDVDGRLAGSLEQLTTGAGQDVELDLQHSPDRIVFTTMRQNAEIWSLPVGSQGEPLGAPKRLIASSRESSRSSFSPDGATIAFNSDRGGPMNLWLFDVATHAVRQLTRGDGGDYQASWAPDGSWLAFFSGRGGSLDIWRVDVNGSSLQCLTSGEGINVNPFVSPDGRAIAFHSDRDGRMEVFLMNADGSDVRQLTSCGASGHFLRWTADGRHMVFRSGAAKPRVARASIEGGELIEYPSVAGGAHISLSPDGLLMFDVMAHQAMWVSPLDGSLPRKAFEFDDPEIRIDYPVWSPDGRSVLFDRLRPQGGDVWMVELG